MEWGTAAMVETGGSETGPAAPFTYIYPCGEKTGVVMQALESSVSILLSL